MGIMSNKVTRRVALGSIAGGLAGTALVLRTLKGRYNANVPDSHKEYETGWEKYVKMVDVPIKKTDGPSTFELNCKPEVGTTFSVVSLTGTYYGDAEKVGYPQLPFLYSFVRGCVTVKPPIVDAKPSLLVRVEKLGITTSESHNEESGGECILVPTNGDIEFFEAGNATPQKLPREKVNERCANIGTGLLFDYPKEENLTVGTKWTVPKTSLYCLDLPCVIVGFAEVAGKKTVKMVAERHLNSQELQSFITRAMEENPIEQNGDATKKRNVERASEKAAMTIQVTPYVELKTGIVIRREFAMKVYNRQGDFSSDRIPTTFVINQLLES